MDSPGRSVPIEREVAGKEARRLFERELDRGCAASVPAAATGGSRPVHRPPRATVAIEAGATLAHRDRHFGAIAAHCGLSVESHVLG